jgi:uncharacterized phage protein (TIGR01671 family)
MNRIIKFRAWCIPYEKAKGFFLKREKEAGSREIMTFGLLNNILSYDYGYNYTFQQFTGLLDKNGKEIYEGDIIKNDSQNGRLCEIRYHTDIYAAFGYRGLECKGDFYHLHTYSAGKDLEIIGNIFENPELLNK